MQPQNEVWASILTNTINNLQTLSPCIDGVETTLSEDFLFSIEDEGCNGGGADYSGIGNPSATYIGDIYSMSHTPNIFNKATFNITDNTNYHFYYSYSDTLFMLDN